ncbi:aminoglycoside 6'-N-acetyltransferase [Ornithinibacillus salinisoli]|uniref:Aminoglycoside N(6')-acetyltransferase type 1 n=1 Tax=Ornithinibacillus salinisoli TaxID=1848459 RepID=A0ABW4VVZ0_9BACI
MEKIIELSINHLDNVTDMAMALWPGHDFTELKEEFSDHINSDKSHVLLWLQEEEPIAFIYLSIRTDYVEGAISSPTGYVEGIYVKPNYRRKGISNKLFNEGKKWMLEKGCKQVGSDIEYDNTVSYDFHTGIGFKESGRLITFIQDLD